MFHRDILGRLKPTGGGEGSLVVFQRGGESWLADFNPGGENQQGECRRTVILGFYTGVTISSYPHIVATPR